MRGRQTPTAAACPCPSMQKLVSANSDDPDMSSIDVFRLLDDPLSKQVRDLRSAVVKEVCVTVSGMAVSLGDSFRPLGYMLLPTMIDVTASGNKVIAGYVHDAVKVMLSHSHVKNAVPIILDVLRSRCVPACVRVHVCVFV